MTYFGYVERQKARVRGGRTARAEVYLRECEYRAGRARQASSREEAEKLSAKLLAELGAMKGLNVRERECCAAV